MFFSHTYKYIYKHFFLSITDFSKHVILDCCFCVLCILNSIPFVSFILLFCRNIVGIFIFVLLLDFLLNWYSYNVFISFNWWCCIVLYCFLPLVAIIRMSVSLSVRPFASQSIFFSSNDCHRKDSVVCSFLFLLLSFCMSVCPFVANNNPNFITF